MNYTQDIKDALKGDLLTLGKVLRPKAHWAPPAPIHYELEKILLNRDIKKANIILPRGLAKSVITAEDYPLYHIFLEDIGQPKLVVLVSKTQAHSLNRLQAIKDTLSYSDSFKAIFGNWGEHTARSWRSDQVILKDGSAIITRGTGQPIRGLNYPGGIRPTLIILDDPEDEANTKTPEAMESNLIYLLKGALPALDTRFGRCLVIGTPIHQRCIVETLADAKDWYTKRAKYLNVDENGNEYSLWKEMKSVESLKEEKESLNSIGRISVWYAERQCEIVGDETQPFKKELIRYWDGDVIIRGKYVWLNIKEEDNHKLKEPRLVPVNIFVGVDPASSVDRRADFSVRFTIAVDKDENIYAIDYYRKRVHPSILLEELLREGEHYSKGKAIQTMRIESIAFQEMLRDQMIKETEKRGIRINGLQFKEISREKKEKRLLGLEPLFYKKKVFLRKDMQEFEDELLMFPNAKNDDIVDGFFYAQKNSYPPFHDHTPEENYTKQVKSKRKDVSWLIA